jgi:hypothetical protein
MCFRRSDQFAQDRFPARATVPFSLKGRTALIAGASSGIGLHMAGVYARVVLAARRMRAAGGSLSRKP